MIYVCFRLLDFSAYHRCTGRQCAVKKFWQAQTLTQYSYHFICLGPGKVSQKCWGMHLFVLQLFCRIPIWKFENQLGIVLSVFLSWRYPVSLNHPSLAGSFLCLSLRIVEAIRSALACHFRCMVFAVLEDFGSRKAPRKGLTRRTEMINFWKSNIYKWCSQNFH